jgi:proteasome component ECM29
LKVSQKYNRSTGSNDDPSARKAAASTLRAIAVRASNQFGDGGTSDLWCRRVLPIAFLGIKDPESNIATLFADVWEEGGSAVLLAGAADGFGSTLEEKLIIYLVDECIKALIDVSWSRRVSGADALRELAVKEILSPAPRRLNGTPKDGNLEESLRAQRRVQASHRALVALTKAIADTRLWSGKQNVDDACCLIASKWSSALANAGDQNEVTGKGLDTRVFAPLALTDHADTDSLFAHDGRFKKQTDEELPDEATQRLEVAMEIDEEESLGETKLDFDNDVVGPDEKTESCVFESSSEDKRMGETLEPVPTFIGICRMFLVQAFPTKRNILSVKEEEVLPYRAASLKALADLLDSIDKSTHGSKQKAIAFTFVTTKLAPLFDNSHEASDNAKEESPLVVSRALDCFGACFWEGIGSAGGSASNKYTNVLVLVQIFEKLSVVELPWTVKMSALNACARLIVNADATSLEDHSTVSAVVNCASQALKDRKFWKVR